LLSSQKSSKPSIVDDVECNVIVMSEAGKPIYFRFGTDEEVARACGLIQAIRMSLLLVDPRLELGDIRSLSSKSLKLVFMTVGSITLVAVARRGRHGEVAETDAYLRLQLECAYGTILLTLTEQVQNVLLQNPNLDLGESLGATEGMLSEILDRASPGNEQHCGTFFLTGGAIESVHPITPHVRERASKVLLEEGDRTDNTVFALLITGKKLLTMVQPRHVPHQLSSFDLHLLIHFINHRPGLLTSELWFPICLPRFNSSGFLHVYTNCLDSSSTQLTLCLVSQANSTEQFQLFRGAALAIRENLGLPAVVGNVLRILDPSNSGTDSTSTCHDDIAWRRSVDFGQVGTSEEDYVDASLDGGGMIPYVFGDSAAPPSAKDSAAQKGQCPLLKDLEGALDPRLIQSTLEGYCSTAQAMHFMFRLDAQTTTTTTTTTTHQPQGGKLTQCLSSPLGFPFCDDASKRRVFCIYQKLQLRLRLGSATCESSMDAFDLIANDQAANDEGHMKGIGRHCPASCLAESSPSVQGVTYVIDGQELFLAISGREFEL
jgi:hypothetical protein